MMGKIAKLFLICTLLLVGVSFADLPYALKFSCSKSTDDVYTCGIEQLQSSKPTANTYTTWGSFLQAFQTEIESKLDISKNPSAKTEYNGFVIRFNSNIDFGGYQKTGDVITCRDATFAPMNFGPLAFQPTIDGNGKTIKNFCYITENINASFFGDLQNSKVQNITFDMAYVKATVTSGTNFDAAVVAYRVANVSFKNVTVSNSLVYGWQTAALAVYSGASSSDRDNPAVALSKIKIQNVTLGITKDVIAGHSTFGSLENLQSASGGVIANIGGYPVMDNIEVSKLKIPDAISEVYKSVSGHEYIGDRYVGGVAGRFEPSADDDGFTLGRISVSADLSGLWVGGLFGRAYIDNNSLTGASYFKLANAKVTLNSAVHSGGNNKARFFGGLVGELHWLRGQISLSNDTVDVSATWHRETDYLNSKACMGGLVGYVYGEEDDTPVDIYAENNVVTAEMQTSAGVVYAGGVLGQVAFVPSPNNETSGEVLVKKSSVKAKATNLIMTTAETINTVCAGYLVGNAVSRGGNINILQNHAEGNIYIANSGVVAAGALGAEIGLGWFSSIDVSNNSSIGDLFPKTIVGNDFAYRIYRGYVAGTLVSENSATTVSVRDNFHYGSMDMSVVDAVDSLKIAGQGKKKSDWRDKCSENLNICFNYRNELKGDSALSVSGVLSKDGSGKIIVNTKDGDYWYNGIIDADVMKSRLFTYVMNATQPSASVAWDNEPSSLPTISSQRTAYRLAISLTDADYKELKDEDKVALKDYLPAKCEAGKCSLYVYTEKGSSENKAVLKPGLKYDFDALKAGFMVIDEDGDVYDLSRTFTKDDKAKGLTDREIKVICYIENPDQFGGFPTPVLMDDYVDDVTLAWPKVEKVRLLSSKNIVPTALLGYNNTKYDLALYQAYTCPANAVFFAGCKNVFSSGISLAQKQMNNIEAVLKEVRTHINDKNGDEIHLYYKLFASSEDVNYLPQVEVGLFNSKAKINVSTYGYDKNGTLTEIDSYELGNTKSLQPNVDIVSKYGIGLAERGFILDSLKVDFWVDLFDKTTDVIKECYNEVNKPAKCEESNLNKYENLTENYFDRESVLENQLNATITNGLSRLMVWSMKLGADEMLDLDSMVQAMSIAAPQKAPNAPMFLGIDSVHVTAIPYKVTFDIRAGSSDVFLTDKFVIKESYSRENDETAKLPEGLLSTKACFKGWDKDKIGVMGESHYTSLDGDLLLKANPSDETSFSLYGFWDSAVKGNKVACEPQNTEMILKVVDKTGVEGDYGTVTLNQSYKKLGKDTETFTHKFNSGKLEIPVSADAMTLHVASVQTNKEYALAKLTLKKADGTELPIKFKTGDALEPGDTSFQIAPAAGMTYTLEAVYAGYIDVSVKVGRNDVFYGSESKVDTIRLKEIGTTRLPKWVYTPTECVLGWSVTPDGADYDHGVVSSNDLIAKVTSEKTLYGAWGSADACVENAGYRRLKLESEHGTVEIVEIVEINKIKVSEKTHAFAEDSTMLLPQDYAHSTWVVRGAPEKGYKLDSVVIDGRIKLVEGDKLADSIQGYLPMKAYFSEDKAPVVSPGGDFEFVRHEPILSGNAMRLTLEWKVKSGKVAELRATFVDALGVPLPDPKIESVTDTGSLDWDVYPLLPGDYRVRVALKNDADSIPPVDFGPFTVSSEIAAAPDTWQMVSLSDVDESSIVWDDDPAFYYWDESAEYGVAWKYQKYNGGAVNAQQGYWYNSLEGRPLVLRKDAVTGSDVAYGAHEMVWELDSGWNMVANPYGWNISLDEYALELYKWEASTGPVPVSVLGPYEAVWLPSDTKKTLPVKAEPWFGANLNAKGLQKAALAKATRESWTLQAVLNDTKGHSDSWNVLGVGEANERLEPPAGMGDYVNLSVVEGKKALLKSIKSADDGDYEWNLALSATTDRVGYLKFEGVKALNEIGLRVYVTVDGKTTELGSGDSLRVMLKAAGSTATVRVSASEIQTVASKLENLRFQRVPGALQVGFDVSSDLAGASYRVQLVGINGKIAATYRGKSTAGHNTLALTAPKPGLYLLRVRVGGLQATRKVAISR
ncbi:hypothetical protein [Fibrobacter sp. UWB10]|uniref:hypothetical protein n=1 Tax=Fibrobacter sp. UWB10 TaxID=1896201 RepID=UPI0024B69926|nr:hypothetical protein [Fibrobacter sp. UWB10]